MWKPLHEALLRLKTGLQDAGLNLLMEDCTVRLLPGTH